MAPAQRRRGRQPARFLPELYQGVIEVILTEHYLACLSHASYLIGDESNGRAVVVDPRRDVGIYPDKAAQRAACGSNIPYKGKNKPVSQNEANRVHAQLRSPGERANAQLKSWRILRKLRCCP